MNTLEMPPTTAISKIMTLAEAKYSSQRAGFCAELSQTMYHPRQPCCRADWAFDARICDQLQTTMVKCARKLKKKKANVAHGMLNEPYFSTDGM